MNIKFTISSNINFYKKTYPILVSSLLKAGVDKNNIYFFVGGYDKYQKVEDEVNLYFVDHNSIDFTGLISVLDLELKSDYWFLLHDTCYVGENFYKNIQTYNHHADIISLRPARYHSMNIGSYKQSYLDSKKQKILEFKNKDYSIESISSYKKLCVKKEDIFFKTSNNQFYTNKCILKEASDFYKNGVLRIIEEYSDIDLYKVKANWYGKSKYELNL